MDVLGSEQTGCWILHTSRQGFSTTSTRFCPPDLAHDLRPTTRHRGQFRIVRELLMLVFPLVEVEIYAKSIGG